VMTMACAYSVVLGSENDRIIQCFFHRLNYSR
jgi:hypothetical protein